MTTTTRDTRALSGIEGCAAIARVTLLRSSRGAALWVVFGLALIPELYALLVKGNWDHVFTIWLLLLRIVVPVLLASAISEEIEEKTMTYLWSRPLPRWSILGGKMAGLVPVAWIALGLALLLPFYTATSDAASSHPDVVRTLLAVVFGTLGMAAATAGLSTLAPRFATVLSIGYLVFIDATLGTTEKSIHWISISYNTKVLAGVTSGSVVQSLVWMAGISATWLAVAVWRVRRLE